jgi:hypothetical protein
LYGLEYEKKKKRKRKTWKMRNAHFTTWNMARNSEKTWKIRHKNCKIWKIARKLKNIENEKCTLEYLEFGEKY